MRISLDISDAKALFVIELLKSFPFVKILPDRTKPKTQTKVSSKEDIVISPFIMEMVSDSNIPANYDYKANYRKHLAEKHI
ncbi:MAG: hypothetical protein LBR45_04565 [Bacteroidales bacterium]|jgi:hypothetical protein|nr:hypothetical protein [Bacteroidales bacterium]